MDEMHTHMDDAAASPGPMAPEGPPPEGDMDDAR